MVVGLIIIVGIAAFFAGSYTSNSQIQIKLTQEDLRPGNGKARTQRCLQNQAYQLSKHMPPDAKKHISR